MQTPEEILAALPEELQPIAEKCMKMRFANVRNSDALEKVGVSIDVSVARQEFLLDGLVTLGVITEAQKWELSLSWEEHLNAQLKQMHQGVQAAQLKARMWTPGQR